jgi:hypothetical protein
MNTHIYFSDIFNVSPKKLAAYGAFNVSPLVDLPLFIDPFLLFTSQKAEYKNLHDKIIRYLQFLREKSERAQANNGLLKAWYHFPEVKQTCLGFCQSGNSGIGLGPSFAKALSENLSNLFKDFGKEQVTKGSHLEKLMLIRSGVGKDKISDFTTNLIKGFLLRYTAEFAKKHIKAEKKKSFHVSHVEFDYERSYWKSAYFDLPALNGDYVLLCPEDLLTKDDVWINKNDLRRDFPQIRDAIANDALRAQVNQYFVSALKRDRDKRGRLKEPTKKQENEAVEATLRKFPEIIDYYILEKENQGALAVTRSLEKVNEVQQMFVENISRLSEILAKRTDFFKTTGSTLEEAKKRVAYLKHVIENCDGYRWFYDRKGNPIEREADLHIAFKLVCIDSQSSVDAEVNNGRGPVDFKLSRGASDASLIEFKLASNTQLERNLQNQVDIYEKANRTTQTLKVILFFSTQQQRKVARILMRLKVPEDAGIVLIDARRENKTSGSKT